MTDPTATPPPGPSTTAMWLMDLELYATVDTSIEQICVEWVSGTGVRWNRFTSTKTEPTSHADVRFAGTQDELDVIYQKWLALPKPGQQVVLTDSPLTPALADFTSVAPS